MAQPPTQQYHLRKRNLSQAGKNLSGDDTNSTLSVIHEETQEKTPRGILGDRGSANTRTHRKSFFRDSCD